VKLSVIEGGQVEGDGSRTYVDELVPGSEDDLAVSFVVNFGHRYKHTPGIGWMVHRAEARVWERDEQLSHFNLARQIARAKAAEEESLKLQRAICSARAISAMLTIAKSDPVISLPAERWDAEPFVLNTPGGAIDLKSGKQLPPSDEDFHTMSSGVAPDFSAKAPLFDRFMLEIALGDAPTVEFLQRMVGSMLTGDRRDQKIFFLQGVGANGKSTFVDLIRRLLASYALKLPASVLMHNPVQNHPTELAQLRGKRLAISSEVEEGQYWAEARIKELTGDERLTARFMRQDFFEFTMTQKHLVVGNHKPRLRGGDAAIARRFLLVPFAAKFEGDKRDPQMLERLWSEAPAIMAWAVKGAMKWAAEGLAAPSSVLNASKSYMEENDDIAQWLDECCVLLPGARGKATPLYHSYMGFLKARGQHVPAMKTWGDRMSLVEGVSKIKSDGVMIYRGVGLKAFEEPAA
jgi:putative DNA primase/helicase